MAGRLSPFFLLFKLSRLPLKEARQSPTYRGLLCCRVCCSYGHEREYNSKELDSPSAKLDRSFRLLGVNKDDCTVEQIKKAYIDSAKRYHPDSNSPDADAENFAKVRDAYKRCVSYAKNVAMSREIYAVIEEEMTDIDRKLGFTKQRRLPHRQYLTYDVGPGTYSQRQKAYAQHRLYEAMDNVYEKQFEKALQNPDVKEVGEFHGKPQRHQLKITKTLERIAHEKIRDSIGRGEFRNLKGMGKPLQRDHDNLAIDNMQQKLNRLLSNAGFAPEWISLDKEIRNSIEKVKKRLTSCWSKCGPLPMSPEKKKEWEHELEELSQVVETINKKINTLNLIVPSITAQRMHMRLEQLVSRVTSTTLCVKHSELSNTLAKETRVEGTAAETSRQPANSDGDGSRPLYSLVNNVTRMFNTWWQRRN